MKHLESFEAAATSLAIDPANLPVVDALPSNMQKAVVAAYKLFIISQAAWKAADKVINWRDYDQYKYYPWFDLDVEPVGSSPGFSYYDCAYDYPGSRVGSRLVFPDKDTARYVGETHLGLYRDLMVID